MPTRAAEDTGFDQPVRHRAGRLAPACAPLRDARPRGGCRSSACPASPATASDFHEIGPALGGDAAEPRLVIAIDSRGRGRSAHDPNPDNYSFPLELADVLAVLTALEIGPAIVLGTSRGGILAMLLGAARPGALAGVILNDIGPVIETKGLMRIKGYVGKMPTPRSFADGAEMLRRLGDAQFTAMTPAQWLAQARRTWTQTGGLVLDYDPKLARTLEAVDAERPVPPLWGAVRFARARSADGGARRQFGHSVVRDGRCDARAPARHRRGRSAGPGSRTAAGRSRRHRPHRRLRHPVRRLGVRVLEHDPEKWTPVFGKDHALPLNLTSVRRRAAGLLQPELVHADESVRVVLLERAPMREVGLGRVVGEAFRVAPHRAELDLETEEFQIVLDKERGQLRDRPVRSSTWNRRSRQSLMLKKSMIVVKRRIGSPAGIAMISCRHCRMSAAPPV